MTDLLNLGSTEGAGWSVVWTRLVRRFTPGHDQVSARAISPSMPTRALDLWLGGTLPEYWNRADVPRVLLRVKVPPPKEECPCPGVGKEQTREGWKFVVSTLGVCPALVTIGVVATASKAGNCTIVGTPGQDESVRFPPSMWISAVEVSRSNARATQVSAAEMVSCMSARRSRARAGSTTTSTTCRPPIAARVIAGSRSAARSTSV